MAARGAASGRVAAMEAASGLARVGLAQGLAAMHVALSWRGERSPRGSRSASRTPTRSGAPS